MSRSQTCPSLCHQLQTNSWSEGLPYAIANSVIQETRLLCLLPTSVPGGCILSQHKFSGLKPHKFTSRSPVSFTRLGSWCRQGWVLLEAPGCKLSSPFQRLQVSRGLCPTRPSSASMITSPPSHEDIGGYAWARPGYRAQPSRLRVLTHLCKKFTVPGPRG